MSFRKKMSIKQRLWVSGHICPQPSFVQLGFHLWRYIVAEGGGGNLISPRPPPSLTLPGSWWWSQERLMIFSRGSEIIELLHEFFCNNEILNFPHSKFCQNHEQLEGGRLIMYYQDLDFFLSIL